MRVAAGAMHFHSFHEHTAVFFRFNRVRINRLVIARPPRSRVKLAIRVKEFLITTNTQVHALVLAVPILASESSLRAFLSSDIILLVIELLLPFFFGLNDFLIGFVRHNFIQQST